MPHLCLEKIFLRAAVAGLLLFAGRRAFAGLPDYRIGETSRVDLLAPSAFTVIDPERTESERLKESMKVPAIYRLNPGITAEAEAALRQAVATNRENFLVAVEAVFKSRAPFAPSLAQPRFGNLIVNFQKEHRTFPLTTNLARLWALGNSEEAVVSPWITRLRELQARPVRAEELPNEGKLGPGQLRLINRPLPARPDLAAVERQFKPMPRGAIVPLEKFRSDTQKGFAPEERVLGKFLSGFLKANCIFEEELTREARRNKAETIWSVKHYAAGEPILRAGEAVDARARAALVQLRAQAAVVELKDRETADALAATATAALPPKKEWPRAAVWGGAAALAGLSGILIWRKAARGKNNSLALARPGSGGAPGLAGPGGALTRAELMPYLARFLSHALVQRLFRQRTRLIQTQQIAAAQTVELEMRLTKIQSHMQQRFHFYEQRIAELEKDLAAAEEQNRELIRAKIVLAKQDLEFERAKGRHYRN